MLDKFASKLRAGGNISWNLAYHPYSSPLTEPRFWANTNRQLTKSLSSPVINMGNIQILTNYIRQKYGYMMVIEFGDSMENGVLSNAVGASVKANKFYSTFRTGLYICTERQKCRETSGSGNRLFLSAV